MSQKYLRKKQVALRYGCSERQVDLMSRDGRLPAPIFLGSFPMWSEDELVARERAAVRPPAKKPKAEAHA